VFLELLNTWEVCENRQEFHKKFNLKTCWKREISGVIGAEINIICKFIFEVQVMMP
jgi:hypothetical protein